MDADGLQTVRADLGHPGPHSLRDAILVHIYPSGPKLGTRYVLGSTLLLIGRGDGCQVQIDDKSVSRQHASVQPVTGGYLVTDLDSTNGTLVNDVAVSTRLLKDGDYLRVGNSIYRFLMGGNLEAQYHEEIYRLVIIDGLTGIANKRHLLEFLDRELARSCRYGRPLTLVLFDVDHFKRINDGLGHLAGDYTLRELAAVVRADIQSGEFFGRYGGEEFAVVLPETPLANALALAERLRGQVEGHAFEFEGTRFAVTISLGVAAASGEESQTAQELIRAADEALYRAKTEGRNCVRGSSQEVLGSAS